MAREPAVAVIDLGKSNAKLALADLATGKVIGIRTMPNVILRDGPYPHFDVERIWDWVLAGLAEFAGEAHIVAISTTTHACAFALLGRDGLALPVLDYEYDGPEAVRADYDRARGDFAETLTPNLPNGLNGGRQIYWQARAFPEDLWARRGDPALCPILAMAADR